MTARPPAQTAPPSPGDRQTESLRAEVLGNRVPVMSITHERDWRTLVANGQVREAAALQTQAARDFQQENRTIKLMNHTELKAYSQASDAGDRYGQLEVVRAAASRIANAAIERKPQSHEPGRSQSRQADLDR